MFRQTKAREPVGEAQNLYYERRFGKEIATAMAHDVPLIPLIPTEEW
jgi:hypothetical protein